MLKDNVYYLYILKCQNCTYYTGITTDPKRRWSEHVSGKAAKYTRAFPSKEMAALWKVGKSRSIAQQLEAKIKSLPRSEKMRLISDPETINRINKLSALTKENKLKAIKMSEFTNSLQPTPSGGYILETKRLILRVFCLADLNDMTRINKDPKVMQYFPSTLTRDETKKLIQKIIKHQKQYGYSLYAVEIKKTKKMIGFVGLIHRTKQEFNTSFMPATEIGWRLDSAYWNQGYATESAIAVLEHGFNQLNLNEVISFTVPDNKSSRRVMEKIGLSRDEENDFKHPALTENHPLSAHVLYRLKKHKHYGN